MGMGMEMRRGREWGGERERESEKGNTLPPLH